MLSNYYYSVFEFFFEREKKVLNQENFYSFSRNFRFIRFWLFMKEFCCMNRSCLILKLFLLIFWELSNKKEKGIEYWNYSSQKSWRECSEFKICSLSLFFFFFSKKIFKYNFKVEKDLIRIMKLEIEIQFFKLRIQKWKSWKKRENTKRREKVLCAIFFNIFSYFPFNLPTIYQNQKVPNFIHHSILFIKLFWIFHHVNVKC